MPGPARTIDVSKRGVPFADPTKNVAVIQAAIDELGDRVTGGSAAVVLLPDDDVPIDRPVFLDRNGVGLEGAGKGVSRLVATLGHDCVVTGVQRKPSIPGGAAPPSVDHFPDLHTSGWLKGNTTAPGQRWAFRTKADHHLAQQGGPLDDFPAGVRALTVELALDLSRLRDRGGSWAAARSASVCGLTEKGVPSPWSLAIGQDTFLLSIRSAGGVTAQFSFGPIPDPAGFVRVTVQVDLAGRDVSAWLDDKRAPITGRLPDGFDAFAANQHCPFGIGSTCGNANVISDAFGGASDLTFAGLRVTLAPLYKGDTLARIDGGPVNEARFFALGPNVKGFLNLTDRPDRVIASRVVSATAADFGGSSVYVLDNAAHSNNFASSAPGPIRHLSLVCNRPQGRGLAVGYALGLRVEDCEVLGGRDGIASLNFGSTYPVTILDCDLAGTDSPLYLFNASSVVVDRVNLPRAFRCGIRLVDCTATMRNVFAPCWGRSDSYVRAVRSSFVLEDSSFDNEAFEGAQLAPIYISPGGGYPTLIRINRCAFATWRTGAPLAILDEMDQPDALPLWFKAEDCIDVIRAGTAQIEAKGARWRVVKDW